MNTKAISFEKWKNSNLDLSESATNCTSCNGKGFVTCWRCGGDGTLGEEESLRPCFTCEDGVVDCECCHAEGTTLYQIYELQYKKDMESLEVFTTPIKSQQ